MVRTETQDAADNWMGEGIDLARRILAYADALRMLPVSTAGAGPAVADDLESIVRKEWDPRADTR